MLITTEQTPNPSTRKFLPEQTVMDAGTRDFPDAESAEASPLRRRWDTVRHHGVVDDGHGNGHRAPRDFSADSSA